MDMEMVAAVIQANRELVLSEIKNIEQMAVQVDRKEDKELVDN